MTHFLTKLGDILSSTYGRIGMIGLAVLDYFAGYSATITITVLSALMDAVWGIAAARKQGRFTLSELARNTYSKLSVYGCCIVLFIGIDKMVGSDTGITTSAICIGIVLVEAWSTCGSMIICYPDLPFLKLLKKALTGEIARKLNVPTDKVDEVLYNLNNRSNAKD